MDNHTYHDRALKRQQRRDAAHAKHIRQSTVNTHSPLLTDGMRTALG
jgi:hypothetical protein